MCRVEFINLMQHKWHLLWIWSKPEKYSKPVAWLIRFTKFCVGKQYDNNVLYFHTNTDANNVYTQMHTGIHFKFSYTHKITWPNINDNLSISSLTYIIHINISLEFLNFYNYEILSQDQPNLANTLIIKKHCSSHTMVYSRI